MMPGRRLDWTDRVRIRDGIDRGDSDSVIARVLGCHRSTVGREITRCGSRDGYDPRAAQMRSEVMARRPKPRLLQADRGLARRVRRLLDKKWSPAPVAAHLKSLGFRICHETIYAELYRSDSVLGSRWKNLVRKRPYRCRIRRTRTGRDTHPLGDISLITGLDADGKAGPGYWEGDLLVGSGSRSACVVLIETTTKKIFLGALQSQTTDEVCAKVIKLLGAVPPQLRRILVWDQGRELARWTTIATLTGMAVFFCEPRSPWQKPLVENTCGHLRRWLPKNANLYLPQRALNQIARLLNNMPRRSLGWHTPNQVYNRLVAMTD